MPILYLRQQEWNSDPNVYKQQLSVHVYQYFMFRKLHFYSNVFLCSN